MASRPDPRRVGAGHLQRSLKMAHSFRQRPHRLFDLISDDRDRYGAGREPTNLRRASPEPSGLGSSHTVKRSTEALPVDAPHPIVGPLRTP